LSHGVSLCVCHRHVCRWARTGSNERDDLRCGKRARPLLGRVGQDAGMPPARALARGETMANAARLKSPVIRLGGKTRLLPTLLSVLEQTAPHTCYCEPFCGGAVLLFAKRPSEVEIINDIDHAVYSFFSVMRDPKLATSLKRKLILTP